MPSITLAAVASGMVRGPHARVTCAGAESSVSATHSLMVASSELRYVAVHVWERYMAVHEGVTQAVQAEREIQACRWTPRDGLTKVQERVTGGGTATTGDVKPDRCNTSDSNKLCHRSDAHVQSRTHRGKHTQHAHTCAGRPTQRTRPQLAPRFPG